MSGVNWIPGISQLKSSFQILRGDVKGAQQTQKDFLRECPIISQTVAVGQAIAGDKEGAQETFKRGFDTVNNVVNGIPIVGHVKGGTHLIFGDNEGASQAIEAATRSTVVMGKGVATGILAAGLVTMPFAVSADKNYEAVDTITSDNPTGVIETETHFEEKPNAGKIFDATATIGSNDLSHGEPKKRGRRKHRLFKSSHISHR